MKKVISFDLDGTLVDARFGEIIWKHGIPLEYAKKHNVDLNTAKMFVLKSYQLVGDNDLLWYRIEHWLEKFQLPVTAEELLDRYDSEILSTPHADEILRELESRYTIIIASNAARCFIEKELAHTGLTRYFHRVISATSDFNMVKKEETFYRRICDDLCIDPGEMIHIGDNKVFDYDVPSRIGIEAYLLTNGNEMDTGNLRGAGIIHNLSE